MKKGADFFLKHNKLHFVLVLASVCVVFIETIFPVYSHYSTQLCLFTTVKLKSPAVAETWFIWKPSYLLKTIYDGSTLCMGHEIYFSDS